MPSYFVTLNDVRKGPISHEKLVGALQSGKIPEAADIIDAESGDIVLREDILDPEPSPAGVDYGRTSSQGATVQRKKAKQPYSQKRGFADYPTTPEVREPGLSTVALIAAILLWPVGLFVSIAALSKCKELDAPNSKAKLALAVSLIWAVFATARIGMWIASGR